MDEDQPIDPRHPSGAEASAPGNSEPDEPTVRFTMRFEPMTIEHLGLKLYSQFPPVISELVSNAYDAEATKVEISVPTDAITEESEVVVRDYGVGMDAHEIQDEYLPIGRNRRGPESQETKSKNAKRTVTGRKGLGKLSAFGVALQSEVRCIRAGREITFCLDYEAIRNWSRMHGNSEYEPEIVTERTGPTDEPDGVEITLKKLRRKTPVDAASLRTSLARRLSVIGGQTFSVFVNGAEVAASDRVSQADCRVGWSWNVEEVPHGPVVDGSDVVRGWFGFLEKARQVGRGVDIFATGKAVELSSYFNLSSTHAQYARAYLVGQIHADFLDAPGEDLVSTARNGVIWEQPRAQKLEAWGQATVKWAFERWVEKQRESKTKRIFDEGNFGQWLEGRTARERRTAQRLVETLADDPKIDDSSIPRLIEIVKSSIEHRAFEEVVGALSAETSTVETLLQLFDEWRIIEAREWLALMDGRLHAIEKLHGFIDEGALEVQQMQPLLAKNLWILDRSWTEADEQPTYSNLLRKHCKEPKDIAAEDRRLDIFAVRAGGAATVVEIKRPEKTLSRDDLDQVEKYVDWARDNIVGTGPDAPKYVNGLLVVGRHNSAGGIPAKVRRLEGDDIRIQTYRDLYEGQKQLYREFDRRLRVVAPEYVRAGQTATVEVKRARGRATRKGTGRGGSRKKPAKRRGSLR